MRSHYLFLLVYLLGSCVETSSAQKNENCLTEGTCPQVPDPTSHFLQCVGLPRNDTGKDHLRRLKGLLEAAMDVYTFMKSSATGVPLALLGELSLNPRVDPLQNEALVQMWLEVKIKPLLSSITKRFLSCLSTKNFSCSTYQTVVRELSHHYSEMNPVRQKWIYMFFMYPFLSGDRVAGCVSRDESSEDWLMKNFGAFRAMARLKDFSTLNLVFSGLEVLHLLSPAQKAELLLTPEVASLDNGTLSLVFHSLLTGGPGPGGPPKWTTPGGHHNWTTPGGPPKWTTPGVPPNWTTPGGPTKWTTPGGHHNWTTPDGHPNWTTPGGHHNWTTPGGHPNWSTPGGGHHWTSPGYHTYRPHPTYHPFQAPPPHHNIKQIVNGFMAAFKPIGSFAHDFVSFTQERKVSEIKSTTLTQFLLNWTLGELADMYRSKNTSTVAEKPKFDVTNVEDWYQQVVIPVLRRFLPNDGDMMHQNIKWAFHQVFYLDHGGMDNETSEIQDVCSITLDKSPCGLTDMVANVATVLNCAARSKLTMSEETVMRMIVELTGRLNLLIKELSTVNFKELAADFQQIFREVESPSLTQHHMEDPDYIKLWFQIKLMPLLPDVPTDLLSCLSTKNFSCLVYQTIVASLSKYENPESPNSNIYKYFIFPFLLRHNFSDPYCVSLANNSAEWLLRNFGVYSRVASITDFYKLNANFSGLEALHVLSPNQTAELLLLPLPTPPDKKVVIDKVFDFLLESPKDRRLPEVLYHLKKFINSVNQSCDVYKQIFERLHSAVPLLPLDTVAVVYKLMNMVPKECLPENIKCEVTQFNATDICRGVDSSALQSHLGTSMEVPCNVSLETYACAQLTNFTAPQLVSLLKCDLPGNSSRSRTLWKMLLTELSAILDPALDMLDNTSMVGPSASAVLDVIGEIRVLMLTDEQLMNSSVIRKWFSGRLSPFLPFVSGRFLLCLSSRNLSCDSYQQIVQTLSRLQPHMNLTTQRSVYTNFIKVFLTRSNTADSSCSSNINSSSEWLQKNLGGFSIFPSFHDLQQLYSNFSAMETLPLLTVKQLAQLSSTPGQLTSPAQVMMVMSYVPNRLLANFFDDFSPAIMAHVNMFPSPVRSAMLQVVFDRANLSNDSVGDSVVWLWLHNRLRPLLVNLSPSHVGPFFKILAGRNCSIEKLGVTDLNTTIASLSEDTRKEIHNHIIQLLKGPIPLHCYNNNNHSFYSFLKSSFMGFQLPNLTAFMTLMPHDRMHQLVNSISPSELAEFLRRPDVVDNDTQLCVIYNNYMKLQTFLDTESLPAEVRRPTLPCVWPMALSSSKRSEVNAWFDRSLVNYLVFLTKRLISPCSTQNASCLAFQKLVSVLGDYNYTDADFMRGDTFDTIRAYLTSAAMPRCYNASDPELNSTAWFAEYIGPFMSFLTLEDLQKFGSSQVIQVFTVNPLNIALLHHSSLPVNLTHYYTELVYQQDSNFNPLLLPMLYRCVAPGPAFSQLTPEESMMTLHNLTKLCAAMDPQVMAALAGNLGDNIDATAISLVGNGSTGMSVGQLKKIKPKDLMDALTTLSNVTGWNEGQAKAIISSLMDAGVLKINSSASLFMLGSLVMGVPAKVFVSISGSQLLTASQNPSFVKRILSSPQVVKETFVAQIISVNSNSEMIIQNVPDEMATEIPRALLLGFSDNSSVLDTLNKKTWKRQQVELFFEVMAVESASAALGGANNLSSSVLQGFTCTGVRNVKKVQIKKLIKACRRTGRRKVKLVETQLTCMYNHIKDDPNATSFDLYPHDMLLYYDYSLVPQARCRSYFQQLSEANFSVFSSALSYKKTDLFVNARSCLNISSRNLTEDNISVLGNMCCTLDGSYIQNSDPSILAKLSNCSDLNDSQVAAAEALLQSGVTQYGAASTWDEQTLKDLGMLPVYFTSSFYAIFTRETKRGFLRYFLTVNSGLSRDKKRRLKTEIMASSNRRSKRSIANECTVGNITHVTISDVAFPFDYDINQFNCCLSASTVQNNLEAIAGKVEQQAYQEVVLSKLEEAYAADSSIPESQVQLLGPVSRVATNDSINMWSITQIDTLSALMDSSDGPWAPSSAEAIITKYLSHDGNTLGSTELNAIGGTNLCSLDVDVLNTITQESLKAADALSLSNCTTEKKQALFTIAEQAFASTTRSADSVSSYQLIQPFIGGADSDYVRSVAAADVNMDMATFISLDENVLLNLNVSEVSSLLGTNVADLKSYENQTVVQDWIRRQPQEELDALGLQLTGGRVDSNSTTTTTSSPTSTNPATATSSPTSANPATATSSPTSANPATATSSPTSANPATATSSPTSANPATATSSPTSANPATATSSPTSANPSTATSTSTSANPSTATSSPTATGSVTGTTGNNGARIRAEGSFSFLVLLVLLITSLV